jgi:hypothetical protein
MVDVAVLQRMIGAPSLHAAGPIPAAIAPTGLINLTPDAVRTPPTRMLEDSESE